LFSISPARKFLDDIAYPCVEESSRRLLRAFWDVMGAKTVHLFKQESAGLEDGSWFDLSGTSSTRMPAGLRALLSRVAEGSGMGHERDRSEQVAGVPAVPKLEIEALELEEAAQECSLRMVRTTRSPGISAGVAFGINEAPLGPRSRWELYLHRGPLPVLELRLCDRLGFRPPQKWRERLLAGEACDVLCVGGSSWLSRSNRGYLGDAHHVYLLLKREKLFPWSKGDSSDSAVAAGQRLRRMCEEAWSIEPSEKAGPFELSSLQWSQKRFVRKFDKLLIECAGVQELCSVLKTMGTDLDRWLRACE